MSLEMLMQKLAIELRNLSTHQLETFKEFTETVAMQVHKINSFWKEIVEQYKSSWDSLDNLAQIEEVKDKPCWIKLTEFMYVEGTMGDKKKILVDIGANYFVNMTLRDAQGFFERRGAQGLEMVENYENLFYKKRLVYAAIDEALSEKFSLKLEKIDKMNEMHEIEDDKSLVVKSKSAT